MLLESQHFPSNQDHNWLGSIGILPAGMLESQQLRSNLDQDWRGMRIVAVRYARITAVSVKSGSRLAERYGDSIRWYARITAVSVKSGSKLAERYGDSNSMPETQQSWSNLDQN